MPPRPPQASPSLLSPAAYDDDVASLRSLSEQDTDSEDDELIKGARSTLELAEHDRTVLEEEDERERLLVRKVSRSDSFRRIFSGDHDNASSVRIGKKERRRQRRSQRRADRRRRKEGKAPEERELMFEMEEGGLRDDSSSRSSISSSDMSQEASDGILYKKSQKSFCRKFSLVFLAIVVLFLILLLGAYKESSKFRSSHTPRTILSNGTSLFAPTTVLISLDGFRADFISQTKYLKQAIGQGVSPLYMLPSFPSVTFPNHFTLVTGLYPESHGVVGNTFWDPALEDDFYYTNPAKSMQPKWWTAEPLWVTAENQGVRTAIHMWPGSEAHIAHMEPTFLDKYNGSESLPRKVDRIFQWLDMPGEEAEDLSADQKRPQFIAAYVPNVDADGHKFGPNSTEIRSTIAKADEMIGSIFEGMAKRNLTDVVNVVVVSDHGMATTSTDRLIQLDDLVDMELVERIDGWPLRGLRPKRPGGLAILHDQLMKVSEEYGDKLEVYTRDTMPERYHFSNNDRIAPLWAIPKAGWAIVEKSDFDVEEAKKNQKIYHPRGLHGYDHEHPLMRAIFVARGPKFPHSPNSRVDVFQNTEVYNIICDSLEIQPHSNNGTLRLPLKPVGLHSDEDAPSLEEPHDPPLSHSSSSPSLTTADVSPLTTISSLPSTTSTSAPTDSADKDADKEPSFWDKVLGKIESFKEWAGNLFGSHPDSDSEN